MPIQVRCPQCQKAYTFPDDKRGKQVRCRDCFQVFFAGDAPADAPPEAVAPPEPLPAPTPKPVAKPAPRPVAAPKPAAEPRRVRKPARPRQPARQAAPPRRRKSGLGIGALLIVLLVLLLAGGVGGAALVLTCKDKLPFLSTLVPADAPPATPAVPKNEVPTPPVVKASTDPADAPTGNLAADLSREHFDKIAKGMTKTALVELFGPPTFTQESKQAGADTDLIWRVGGVGPRVTVSMHGGRVIAKASGQDWPVVYPGDTAANPPPDVNPPKPVNPPPDMNPPKPVNPPPDMNPPKPGEVVTQENFNKIAKGMTPSQLIALLGPPTDTLKFKQPDFDLRLGWTTHARSMDAFLLQGKVVTKLAAADWPIVYPK